MTGNSAQKLAPAQRWRALFFWFLHSCLFLVGSFPAIVIFSWSLSAVRLKLDVREIGLRGFIYVNSEWITPASLILLAAVVWGMIHFNLFDKRPYLDVPW